MSETQYAQLRAQIAKILAYLEPWGLAPWPREARHWTNTVDAVNPTLDAASIHFRLDKGRYIITGNYPQGFHPWDEADRPRITVSAGREPRRIAADIQRRFLDDYLAALEQSLARQRRTLIAVHATNRAITRLAAIAETEPSNLADVGGRRPRFWLPHIQGLRGNVEATYVDATPVFDIDLRSVPYPIALDILNLLMDAHQVERELCGSLST